MSRVSHWTFNEARMTIVLLEELAKEQHAGWHFALAGGVLLRGSSTHDVDIIAFPHVTLAGNRKALRRVLRTCGWYLRMKAWELHKYWRRKGSPDRKHVEVWKTTDGRRVDLMIMGDR